MLNELQEGISLGTTGSPKTTLVDLPAISIFNGHIADIVFQILNQKMVIFQLARFLHEDFNRFATPKEITNMQLNK